jgi:arylsulfatase A-like enzyme
MEVANAEAPNDTDGISFAPTLFATGEQRQHDVMYWELGRQQAVRQGDWKLYRVADGEGNIVTLELFNLAEDIGEQDNLAASQPEKVAELIDVAARARVPSEIFPSAYDAETLAVSAGGGQ